MNVVAWLSFFFSGYSGYDVLGFGILQCWSQGFPEVPGHARPDARKRSWLPGEMAMAVASPARLASQSPATTLLCGHRCSGTSVRSTRDVAASSPTRCRGSRIFLLYRSGDFGFVTRHRPAEHRIPDVSAAPTLRRRVSRPVAAGVSLSLQDFAASQYVCSCGAATLSSHDSSFGSGSSSTSHLWCHRRSRVHEGLRSSDRGLYSIAQRAGPKILRDRGDHGTLAPQMEPEDIYSQFRSATPGMLLSILVALRVKQFRWRTFTVAQRVTTNLFVDKVDRCTLELQMETEVNLARFWRHC